jgi:hypothetical protein
LPRHSANASTGARRRSAEKLRSSSSALSR